MLTPTLTLIALTIPVTLTSFKGIDAIDPLHHGNIIAEFLQALSEGHLPQRTSTYRRLQFGVPITPFMSSLQLASDARTKPFWLVWSNKRGCYGMTQVTNKIGCDPFCEFSPELTPLISAYITKLAAGTPPSKVWGMPVFPCRRGTVFSEAGFTEFEKRHWACSDFDFGHGEPRVMNHRHSVGDYLVRNGITPRGTMEAQNLAASYAAGMNTSARQLSGTDIRHGSATVGAYNKCESALLGLNLLAAQHYRGLMFKGSSGCLVIPDFRDPNSLLHPKLAIEGVSLNCGLRLGCTVSGH